MEIRGVTAGILYIQFRNQRFLMMSQEANFLVFVNQGVRIINPDKESDIPEAL